MSLCQIGSHGSSTTEHGISGSGRTKNQGMADRSGRRGRLRLLMDLGIVEALGETPRHEGRGGGSRPGGLARRSWLGRVLRTRSMATSHTWASDLQLTSPRKCGSWQRAEGGVVPLWPQTTTLLRAWCRPLDLRSDAPVFVNQRGLAAHALRGQLHPRQTFRACRAAPAPLEDETPVAAQNGRPYPGSI